MVSSALSERTARAPRAAAAAAQALTRQWQGVNAAQPVVVVPTPDRPTKCDASLKATPQTKRKKRERVQHDAPATPAKKMKAKEDHTQVPDAAATLQAQAQAHVPSSKAKLREASSAPAAETSSTNKKPAKPKATNLENLGPPVVSPSPAGRLSSRNSIPDAALQVWMKTNKNLNPQKFWNELRFEQRAALNCLILIADKVPSLELKDLLRHMAGKTGHVAARKTAVAFLRANPHPAANPSSPPSLSLPFTLSSSCVFHRDYLAVNVSLLKSIALAGDQHQHGAPEGDHGLQRETTRRTEIEFKDPVLAVMNRHSLLDEMRKLYKNAMAKVDRAEIEIPTLPRDFLKKVKMFVCADAKSCGEKWSVPKLRKHLNGACRFLSRAEKWLPESC